MKSKEELKKIADECYDICDASYNENGAVEFKEYAESYISNSYSELSSDEENTIFDMIEEIIKNESKISKEKIIKIVEKYDDCTIEELYENSKVVGNWCIITGNLKERRTKFNVWFDGGIFGLTDELKKFDNIKNINTELMNGENGYYEYVSFEWD